MGKTRNDWFVAPSRIREGQKVAVMFSGNDCFLCHLDGTLVKLKPQDGTVSDLIEAETGIEHYDDFLLKSRLAEELDVLSGGRINMRKLPDSLDDDINEFCSKARTTQEIREKARYFIMVTDGKEMKKAKIIPSSSPQTHLYKRPPDF